MHAVLTVWPLPVNSTQNYRQARSNSLRRGLAKTSNQRPGSKRRGAAVVEFAVVAPLLFMLLLGTVEMGRFVMIGQLTESAASIGGREAAKTATESSGDVTESVAGYLQNAGVPSDAVTVSVDPTSLYYLDAGDDITVTVQVSFAEVTWLPPFFLPADLQVQGTAVVARE